LPIAILLATTAVFAFGIVQLFELRFEGGDVYPAYSSLRADPLGAMAFYESLEKIPSLSVRRDLSATDRLPEESQTVYLHLAGHSSEFDWMSKELFQSLQNYLAHGNRLVFTLFPRSEPQFFHAVDDEETNSVKSAKEKDQKMTPPKKKHKNSEEDQEAGVALEDLWHFQTGFQKLEPTGASYAPARAVNKTDLPLPKILDWHSGLVFTNLDSAWRVIYARGTNAVVIERKFGRGSVVIAADSYFISNEAMAKDRHADLLAWLIGQDKNVVFDEAHFGITETSGVAALMRKYRLHGLAAGLLLLALLFIWKNSTGLVPPLLDEQAEHFVAGKDSAAGFANLLRRSIAPRDLLAACYAEWKKSLAQNGAISTARVQRAEAIVAQENSLPDKDRNPIATYRKISEVLGTRHQQL
jgi:hypothetical protein